MEIVFDVLYGAGFSDRDQFVDALDSFKDTGHGVTHLHEDCAAEGFGLSENTCKLDAVTIALLKVHEQAFAREGLPVPG